VGRLSGGEQARVLIAKLMLEPADLLLLDEPGNDLDIPTLEALEESLLEFGGALVLVTHDRYLLDRVSTQILALDGRGGATFYADYAQWELVVTSRRSGRRPTASRRSRARRRALRRRGRSVLAIQISANGTRWKRAFWRPRIASQCAKRRHPIRAWLRITLPCKSASRPSRRLRLPLNSSTLAGRAGGEVPKLIFDF